MGRYIKLDKNNKVISIRFGPSIVEGEIESETGALGQIMQPDGTFIDDPTPQPEPPINELEAKINYIYLKMKGLI